MREPERQLMRILLLLFLTTVALGCNSDTTTEKANATSSEGLPATPATDHVSETAKSDVQREKRVTVVDDPAGYRYTVLKEGSGSPPPLGATVLIHWTGWLPDGTEIGNTRNSAQPSKARLSEFELISGLVKALSSMKPGERRKLQLSSEIGYGAEGYPSLVPADSALTIDVELVSVER